MNHPTRDVLEEILWMAEMGLEFLDLTLEPPAAASWRVDAGAIRQELERHGMGAVGHTAYYLPIESPFEELRQAAVFELKRCIDLFAEIGVRWMNVHPGRYTPMHPRSFFVERDLLSLRELHAYGEPKGVGIMVENIPGDFNTVDQLRDLLDPMPELGLHLDVGHSNIGVPPTETVAILKAFPGRTKHVHFHDNNAHADLHLPLGAGNIDFPSVIQALKEDGYDDTIALEVFSPDPHFLRYSRDRLREMWGSGG